MEKVKGGRTPTPRRVKFSEKQIEAEDSAAKQALDSHDKLTIRLKPLCKPGLPLERKIEHAKREKNVLVNEYNRLKFAAKEKETKLKELQELLKTMEPKTTDDNSEDTAQQQIRQLENNREKMKLKILAAKRVQSTYLHMLEHLQQEVRGMFKVLDQKERAVAIGQAEVDKACKMFQSAAAAAESAQDEMFQMENEIMEKKRQMESELKELMETFGRPLSPAAPSRQKEREVEEGEEEEEEAHSSPVEAHHCYDICGASQSDMKLVEDMESLREALGCADVQDLVNKVVSQRATTQQLLTEITQCEELVRQEARTLAELELQHAELKFSVKPAATRFDKLKEETQAKLDLQVDRVQRLQAELKQSQDLLDTVEQGVGNLYFRMSCVPVEGLPSAPCTDNVDKLKDISARLPTLLQRASERKPVISSEDQERVFSFLELLNTTDSRNNKRPSTPIDTSQLSDDGEECSPSREEIKRSSVRLVESQQSKKSSRRAKRKE
ncbi:MAR-binding filament-like protein 1-1 isoform X1 [Thunnus albacares]|uniref:MAR-binding filament-like protein 1-1 isoform X1 n=2 Tax=Thunnus albacares TaxID=8236 RepID=UPI001CF61C10|nr:MAR-binding filament-like protein 1-1 isoform X1 [Thunnus albacares]